MSGRDEEEPMDTSGTLCHWYFMPDCGGWHRFEDDPENPLQSEILEQYFFGNSHHLNPSLFRNINISAMEQIDSKTGLSQRILRSPFLIKCCSCFNTGPAFWEGVDLTCPYQLIPLNRYGAEYQTVETFTRVDGLLGNSILSIKRIQNVDLWEFYCRKKLQLGKIHGAKGVEERRLFHGTAIDNVDSICKHNFDVQIAGEHGHAFGRGIYFAKYASCAAKYSRAGVLPGSHWGFPAKVLLLARVIVGKSNLGETHFSKPDHGHHGHVHQSSVDRIANPGIFIIFDPNQIYPEYLIEYI